MHRNHSRFCLQADGPKFQRFPHVVAPTDSDFLFPAIRENFVRSLSPKWN